MFDGYHTNIQRADAIRYFILYEHGGVYADLDFEALRPLTGLLDSEEMADVGVILGQEPWAHSQVLYDQPRMLCNAIMLSCPHHPFWKAVIDELHVRYDAGIKTVRKHTSNQPMRVVSVPTKLRHAFPNHRLHAGSD